MADHRGVFSETWQAILFHSLIDRTLLQDVFRCLVCSSVLDGCDIALDCDSVFAIQTKIAGVVDGSCLNCLGRLMVLLGWEERKDTE